MKIRWTEKAASDIEGIYDFISQNNPDAALNVVLGLYDSIAQLRTFPGLGRAADEQFSQGTRVLLRPPYLIFYHVVEDAIVIDSILHGNRRH
jgi:toxin ParE1/3/4